MVSLFCVLCNEEFRSNGTIPATCPRCLQTTRWSTRPSLDVPTVRWFLEPNDKRFLRSIKIDAEETSVIKEVL